jgi:hypothetical protein
MLQSFCGEISSKFNKSTSINSKEIELKDQIQGKYYIKLNTLSFMNNFL